MKLILIVFLLLCLNLLSEVHSKQIYQTDVVALRLLKNPTTSQVQVLSKEELQKFQNFDQVLQSIPSLQLNRTGSRGSQTTVFFRGLSLANVLFMIDGIPVNDPASNDYQFNPAFMDLKNIERVEIIKGAQSVLYGSAAIAGVINVITKKADEKFHFEHEAGSYDFSNTFLSGKVRSTYVSVEREFSNGISHVEGPEEDGFENMVGTINYKKGNSQFLVKAYNSRNDEDGYGYADDLDNETKTKQLLVSPKHKYYLGAGVLVLQPSFFEIKRKSISDKTYEFTGQSLRNDFFYHYPKENLDVIVGSTQEKTFFKDETNKATSEIYSLYSSTNFHKNHWLAELGARLDHHQMFGSVSTYQWGIGREIQSYKIAFTEKTTFKAPTLYQLKAKETAFGPIGNEDLEEEKGLAHELSFSKSKTSYDWHLNFYQIEREDLIAFDSVDGFKNGGNNSLRGGEILFNKKMDFGNVGVGTNILWWEENEKVLRMPQQKYNAFALINFNENKMFSISSVINGPRRDINENGGTTRLAPYTLFDSSFMIPHWKFAINNLLDQKYREAYGYQTMGRNFNVTFFAGF